MRIFTLPNLKVSVVASVDLDQALANVPPLPPSLDSKDRVKEWRNSEHTRHVFYSVHEGYQSSSRVSQDQNPTFQLHGFVGDYDANFADLDEIADTVARNKVPGFEPCAVARTFSGGAQVIWEFEQPVTVVNPKMLAGVLGVFENEARVRKLLAGYDAQSSRPKLYYTLYPGTKRISRDKVSANATANVLFKVGTSSNFLENEGVPALPWDVIEENIHALFPGRWPGHVREGARGPRFWDPTATDPTAALLTEYGVLYFTDGGGFLPWGSSRLFGPALVKKYEADKVGAVTKDIYFDGKRFWRRNSNDDGWLDEDRTTLSNILNVYGDLSLSPAGKGKPSEVNRALGHIQNNQRVVGAIPFLFRPEKVVNRWDGVFVNTSTARLARPHSDPQGWGTNFPFIGEWLGSFFDQPFSFHMFMSWLHHFYRTAHEGRPRSGQALFLVGTVGVGKTLLNQVLLPAMFGGGRDVSNWMMGKDQFNRGLFHSAVWTIDDQEAVTTVQDHQRYSSLVKKVTANHIVSMRGMYTEAVDVEWLGRVVVTMNADPESMGMLPALNISNRDKVLVLCTAKKGIKFPVDAAEKIQEELPFFCRWVLDYAIPKPCRGPARFGTKGYVETELLDEISMNSPERVLIEMLLVWRESYFKANPGETEWFGNTTELIRELSREFESEKTMLQELKPFVVSKRIKAVVTKYPWIVPRKRHGKSGFLVERPRDDSSSETAGYPGTDAGDGDDEDGAVVPLGATQQDLSVFDFPRTGDTPDGLGPETEEER